MEIKELRKIKQIELKSNLNDYDKKQYRLASITKICFLVVGIICLAVVFFQKDYYYVVPGLLAFTLALEYERDEKQIIFNKRLEDLEKKK